MHPTGNPVGTATAVDGHAGNHLIDTFHATDIFNCYAAGTKLVCCASHRFTVLVNDVNAVVRDPDIRAEGPNHQPAIGVMTVLYPQTTIDFYEGPFQQGHHTVLAGRLNGQIDHTAVGGDGFQKGAQVGVRQLPFRIAGQDDHRFGQFDTGLDQIGPKEVWIIDDEFNPVIDDVNGGGGRALN